MSIEGLLIMIFGAVLYFVFSAVFFIFIFFFVGRQKKYEQCTVRTKGKVIGYGGSRFSIFPGKYIFRDVYSDGRRGVVLLPKVEYVVDGKKYTVNGPDYERVELIDKKSNIKPDIRAKVLRCEVDMTEIKSLGNGKMYDNKVYINDIFPIDMEIDVFYDPKKPKRAYVLRKL